MPHKKYGCIEQVCGQVGGVVSTIFQCPEVDQGLLVDGQVLGCLRSASGVPYLHFASDQAIYWGDVVLVSRHLPYSHKLDPYLGGRWCAKAYLLYQYSAMRRRN